MSDVNEGQSTALAVQNGTEVSEKLGRSSEETAYRVLMHQAKVIAESGLFGVKNPQQALALMLVSQAEGRHPALAARDYDIIQGRPSKKAEAMLRDFIAAGGSVEWHTLTDTSADATFSHQQGGTVRITWDMERAKKAGLKNKDMYDKYPRQMLRSRVVSEGVRTVYPAATSGMYVPEEVQEFGADRSEARTGVATNRAGSDVPSDPALGTRSAGASPAVPVVKQLGFNVAGEAIQVGVKRDHKTFGKPLSQLTEAQILEAEFWAAGKPEYEAWYGAAEMEVKTRKEKLAARMAEPMDGVPAALTHTSKEERDLDARLAASGK